MTVAAQRTGSSRHYALTYQSDAVGADAEAWRRPMQQMPTGNSVTIEQRQAALFWQIVAARQESEAAFGRGEIGRAVSKEAVDSAIELLHALPGNLPDPQIAAEDDGDITFEWYKDRRHGAVLVIDGQRVRWSAIFGTAASTSGSEAFSSSVPGLAVQAIWAALD